MPRADYYLDREISLKEEIELYYRALIGAYTRWAKYYEKIQPRRARRYRIVVELVRRERREIILSQLGEVRGIKEEFKRRNLIWLTKVLYNFAVRQEKTIIGISGYLERDLPEFKTFLERLRRFRRRIRHIVEKLGEQYPGLIYGWVRDKETKEPLIGAEVRIDRHRIIVNHRGVYSFETFPGKYRIRVSFENYETQEKEVELHPFEELEVNFELEKIIWIKFVHVLAIATRDERLKGMRHLEAQFEGSCLNTDEVKNKISRVEDEEIVGIAPNLIWDFIEEAEYDQLFSSVSEENMKEGTEWGERIKKPESVELKLILYDYNYPAERGITPLIKYLSYPTDKPLPTIKAISTFRVPQEWWNLSFEELVRRKRANLKKYIGKKGRKKGIKQKKLKVK
jgi:PAS domain-containing protein